MELPPELDDKFDIKLNNIVMYLQCFKLERSVLRCNGEFGNSLIFASVHKTLKSAASKLFETALWQLNITDIATTYCCSNYETYRDSDDSSDNYIYDCYEANTTPNSDTYACMYAQDIYNGYEVLEIDKELEDIRSRLNYFVNERDYSIKLEAITLL